MLYILDVVEGYLCWVERLFSKHRKVTSYKRQSDFNDEPLQNEGSLLVVTGQSDSIIDMWRNLDKTEITKYICGSQWSEALVPLRPIL